MEQGNPRFACATGPVGRSRQPQSRPEISECETRGWGAGRLRDFWAGMGLSASVSSPSTCPAGDLNAQIWDGFGSWLREEG